jgi:hypothetical protein
VNLIGQSERVKELCHFCDWKVREMKLANRRSRKMAACARTMARDVSP